jgi:hypothetical protein
VPPVSVTVSPSSASLQPGQTQQFSATVTGTEHQGYLECKRNLRRKFNGGDNFHLGSVHGTDKAVVDPRLHDHRDQRCQPRCLGHGRCHS